ncbi:resuscitation-promoting factor [Streptomyces sp. t39]|nr:resuscitation-promoting factor [Streptomyces sp. t39]
MRDSGYGVPHDGVRGSGPGGGHAPTVVDARLADTVLAPSVAGAHPTAAGPAPTVVDARLAQAYAPTLPYVDLKGAGLTAPALPRQGAPGTATGGRAQARRAARRRRAAPRADGLRRLVPQALVVAFLAGGTAAFVGADKAVRLTVDGEPRTLHTFADDVAELLDDEGVRIGPHDLVAPGPEAGLDSGDEVVVRYGRPLVLTLDGHRRTVWTTAETVEGALRQLGVRATGAYLSVSRSAAIGRTGLTVDMRTERSVTFMADGRERTLRTTAPTVREALADAGIALHGQDTTSVPMESFPRDGQTITVMRITATRETRDEPVPHAVERTEDATLFAGTEVVERQGEPGIRRVTYGLRTVNGVRHKPRRLHEEIVREPVAERIRVGTRRPPDSVAGADGLDWDALARCESGGRPGAVDPSGTYGGLYQFDAGTWRSLGGSGRPEDAPAAEQTYRAKKLYVQRGASPWPHCGRRL